MSDEQSDDGVGDISCSANWDVSEGNLEDVVKVVEAGSEKRDDEAASKGGVLLEKGEHTARCEIKVLFSRPVVVKKIAARSSAKVVEVFGLPGEDTVYIGSARSMLDLADSTDPNISDLIITGEETAPMAGVIVKLSPYKKNDALLDKMSLEGVEMHIFRHKPRSTESTLDMAEVRRLMDFREQPLHEDAKAIFEALTTSEGQTRDMRAMYGALAAGTGGMPIPASMMAQMPASMSSMMAQIGSLTGQIPANKPPGPVSAEMAMPASTIAQTDFLASQAAATQAQDPTINTAGCEPKQHQDQQQTVCVLCKGCGRIDESSMVSVLKEEMIQIENRLRMEAAKAMMMQSARLDAMEKTLHSKLDRILQMIGGLVETGSTSTPATVASE